MARQLKVFGTTLMLRPNDHSRLGLGPSQRQGRFTVACYTKAEAARKFNISLHEARQFMSETGNEIEVSRALAQPGVVFATPCFAKEPVIEVARHA